MRKIIIDTFELKELMELLKLYGADKKNPEITDLAWSMDTTFDTSEFKEDLAEWSKGQIQFREPKEENNE
jgi:hypothetical protein